MYLRIFLFLNVPYFIYSRVCGRSKIKKDENAVRVSSSVIKFFFINNFAILLQTFHACAYALQ